MKKSFILMSLVLGALALTSCNNSDIESINTDKGTFSFTVSTDTRATIEGYSVSWENGDIIALGAAQAGDTSVAAKEFVWKNSNTFTADTTYNSAQMYDFYAIYPAAIKKGQCFTTEKVKNPNAYSQYLNVGAKEFSQNGSSMDSVMKYAPMYGTSMNSSPDNLHISMHHAAALLDFAITNGTEDAITIKSFKMETPADNKFCGTYYVSYDGTLTPSGDKYVYNSCQVNVINGTSLASKSGAFHIYMPIAPVTLANGAAVKFTITTTDDKVCVINKTLKKEVTFGAGNISAQTLLFESAGSITYSTISEINAAGDYNVKDAVVLAVAGSNVILGDGTGNILAYKSSSGLTAGQIVTVAGTIKAYNGVWEFDKPTFTVTGTLDPFSRGTAIAYDEAAIASYESSPIVDYVTVSGSLTDANTLTIGSHVFYTYAAAEVSLTSFVGKNVECEGYVFGNNPSSHKTSYAITSIKETSGTTPSITLPSSSATFEASESGSAAKKSVDFTAENTNVTITCSTADWLEFSANNSTKHFEFYPKSANTGAARTATVTIAASAGSQYNQTFTITQKAAGAGSNQADLTEAEIKANFSNERRSYGTEVTYVDGAVSWIGDVNVDVAGRPWIQIKKDKGTGYVKIVAPNPITEVTITMTSSSNSSGGVADITKHSAFAGDVHLKTSSAAGTSDTDDVAKTSTVVNNVVTLKPAGDNTTLYVKTSVAARIWNMTIKY